MNLYEVLSQKDRELLGSRIEDKDYSQEDLKQLLLSIETDIINCSIKNDDMNKMSSQFSNIINVLENEIKEV